MKQLPYNYDNFKKLHDRVEDQEELIISLSAQLSIAESKAANSKPKAKAAKAK